MEQGEIEDGEGLGEFILTADIHYAIQRSEDSEQIVGTLRSVPVIRKLRSSYNKKTCTLNRRGKWETSQNTCYIYK